jgi:hypothetical protein
MCICVRACVRVCVRYTQIYSKYISYKYLVVHYLLGSFFSDHFMRYKRKRKYFLLFHKLDLKNASHFSEENVVYIQIAV